MFPRENHFVITYADTSRDSNTCIHDVLIILSLGSEKSICDGESKPDVQLRESDVEAESSEALQVGRQSPLE